MPPRTIDPRVARCASLRPSGTPPVQAQKKPRLGGVIWSLACLLWRSNLLVVVLTEGIRKRDGAHSYIATAICLYFLSTPGQMGHLWCRYKQPSCQRRERACDVTSCICDGGLTRRDLPYARLALRSIRQNAARVGASRNAVSKSSTPQAPQGCELLLRWDLTY